MASQTSADVLFEIKNSFYIGNYLNCITDTKFNNPALQLEKDIFMYRAYIALCKFGVVINDINSSSPSELQYVRMLAVYSAGDTDKKKDVLISLEQKLKNMDPEDKLLPLISGLIYYMEENYDAVLRLLHKSDNLECCALVIQTYLKINRVDLAQKEWNSMKEIDEDHTLTQLSLAWLNLSKNGEKLQDAFYIYQELCEKYKATPLLLNGQAAALLAMGKYEEAEPLLQSAISMDPNCAVTLINLIVVSQHLGKSTEVCQRYLSQVKDSHRTIPFVSDYNIKEAEFDRLAKMYYSG